MTTRKTSTGHTLTIDTTRMLLSIAGPTETMDGIPDAAHGRGAVVSSRRRAPAVWYVEDRETGRVIAAGLTERQAERMVDGEAGGYYVAVRGAPPAPTSSDARDWDRWRNLQGYSGGHS